MFLETTQPGDVNADPFSLDALIAWLEKQPAADTYCWTNSGECLVTQYRRAIGEDIEFTLASTFPPGWRLIAFGAGDIRHQTFGAALRRARAARRRS